MIIVLIMLEGNASENRISKNVKMVAIGATFGAVGAAVAYKLHNKYGSVVKDYAYTSASMAGPIILREGIARVLPITEGFPLVLSCLISVSGNIIPGIGSPVIRTFRERNIYGIWKHGFVMVATELVVLNCRYKIVDLLASHPATVGSLALGGVCGVGTFMVAKSAMERYHTAQFKQKWQKIIYEKIISCAICMCNEHELSMSCEANSAYLFVHCQEAETKHFICKTCADRITHDHGGVWKCPQRNDNCVVG